MEGRDVTPHIQGPQTDRQHFNTGAEPVFVLRVASGLRPYIRSAMDEVYPFLWFEAHGHDDQAGPTPPSSR